MSHKGLHSHRLQDNAEEQRFATAWTQWNRHGLTILAALLDARPHAQRCSEPPQPAARDHVVAATLIQWLGSPVGQSFLEELGYTRAVDGNKLP